MAKYYNVRITPISQAECNQLVALTHSKNLRRLIPFDPPFRVGQATMFWSDGTYTTDLGAHASSLDTVYTVNEFAAVLNTGL